MSMSVQVTVQNPISQRCDVVTKTQCNHQVMRIILMGVDMCPLNVKRSCLCQNVFAQYSHMQRQTHNQQLQLPESVRS